MNKSNQADLRRTTSTINDSWSASDSLNSFESSSEETIPRIQLHRFAIHYLNEKKPLDGKKIQLN